MAYASMSKEFMAFHSTPLNVVGHMLTTPFGLGGALAALHAVAPPAAVPAVVALYAASLLAFVPGWLWALSAAELALITAGAVLSQASLLQALLVAAAGYAGQEAMHWITGEKTYESSYIKKKGGRGKLLVHGYFLVPLCFEALALMQGSPLEWLVSKNEVLFCKLSSEEQKKTRAGLRDWVVSQKPSTEHTTHWWHLQLPADCKKHFDALAYSDTVREAFHARFDPRAWVVEPVEGMNEIYVASEHHNFNSDTVFYMDHCDGPWSIWPFCGLYRCMLAINENKQIRTVFPDVDSSWTLTDGDCAIFDFNREIHLIDNNPEPNVGHRISLKLHYVVYPRCLAPVGRWLKQATTAYNIAARYTFLNTLEPTGIWRLMAWVVLASTKGKFLLEKHVGANNIAYVAALGLVSFLAGSCNIFLAGTSFVHYLIYISTYHVGSRKEKSVSFGAFKRNAVFYKTLAGGQLAFHYLTRFELDPVSLALLAAGYGLAVSSMCALGFDATYFGVELGYRPAKFVTQFPYGTVPHPMILGGIVGSLGFHKLAPFRAAFPWLVPIHVALYVAHCLQESVFDVYKFEHGRKE